MALPNEARYFYDLNPATTEADTHLLALQQGSPPAGGVSPTPTRKWTLAALRTWLTSYFVRGDQASVISVNSVSTALRITQIGTGDSLMVEDAANPDSTPFVVNNAGRVLVGHTAALNAYVAAVSSDPAVQCSSPTSSAAVSVTRWTNDVFEPKLFLNKSRGASAGVYTSVSNGDQMGAIYFSGADGTRLVNGAAIIASVDGVPGATDMPGRLEFHTTPDGTGVVSERMRITSAGNVGINETSPDYKLDVNGSFGFSPGSSVTPVDNGDVVFELTNNTTLTVKAKGSDGTVRSGTIALS
jgi:hypothetical protein